MKIPVESAHQIIKVIKVFIFQNKYNSLRNEEVVWNEDETGKLDS